MVTLSDFAGFDPFHETQKGLADLLESESKAAEAQQHQQVSTIKYTTRDWEFINVICGSVLRILLRIQASYVSFSFSNFIFSISFKVKF
jgi:hypothetical protein